MSLPDSPQVHSLERRMSVSNVLPSPTYGMSGETGASEIKKIRYYVRYMLILGKSARVLRLKN